MVTTHAWNYLAPWVVMLLASIANGAVRDLTYGARMGELAAHQPPCPGDRSGLGRLDGGLGVSVLRGRRRPPVAEVISQINIGLAMVEDGPAFAYRRYLNGCDASAQPLLGQSHTYLDGDGEACEPLRR